LNVVLWILAGAILGSAANLVLGTRNRAGIALDIVTGIASVIAGGWLLGVLTKTSAFAPGEFSPASLLIALMGATAVLAALQLYRGRRSGETETRPDTTSAEHVISGLATPSKMRGLT